MNGGWATAVTVMATGSRQRQGSSSPFAGEACTGWANQGAVAANRTRCKKERAAKGSGFPTHRLDAGPSGGRAAGLRLPLSVREETPRPQRAQAARAERNQTQRNPVSWAGICWFCCVLLLLLLLLPLTGSACPARPPACALSHSSIGLLPILFLPPSLSLTHSSSPIHLFHTHFSPTPIKPLHLFSSSFSVLLLLSFAFSPHESHLPSAHLSSSVVTLTSFVIRRRAKLVGRPINQFVSALRRCRPSCFESHPYSRFGTQIDLPCTPLAHSLVSINHPAPPFSIPLTPGPCFKHTRTRANSQHQHRRLISPTRRDRLLYSSICILAS